MGNEVGSAKWAVVMPAYREGGRIGRVIEGVLRHCPDVIVVDDGSDDATAAESEAAGATVIRHARNMGKGAALNTAFRHARGIACEFVVAMDSDGQHDPDDIPAFLAEYRRGHPAVVVGNRMDGAGAMPFVRRMTNRYMSWLLSRRMGQRVPDTQCGFRLYRCDVIPEGGVQFEGFAAESEILLRLAAAGALISSVPIRVIYGTERSKIRPVRDTIRFYRMLWRLSAKRA